MLDRILLVDDDQNVLHGLCLTLRGQFKTYMARGGLEALDIMRDKGPFAVLVSDLRMPGMDGVELLAKAREFFPSTVRVMLTGHGDMEAAMAAVNRGEVFRFLVKPCSPKILLAALRDAQDKYWFDELNRRAASALRDMFGEAESQEFEPLSKSLELSQRERAIANRIRAGDSTKQIALDLHLSTRTVESHREAIRRKLGIANRKINLQRYLKYLLCGLVFLLQYRARFLFWLT